MLKEYRRRKKSVWSCDECGKDFLVDNMRISRKRPNARKFCSPGCRKVQMKTVDSQRVVNFIKNNKHPLLSRGCGVTTDGYIWIRVIGKPNNQMKLHRYLMEIKLGRELKPSEIVHHINEDKFDNRIENLEVVTISEHNRKHGNLKPDKRTDCYTDEEMSLVMSELSVADVHKLLPHRTERAIAKKRRMTKALNPNPKRQDEDLSQVREKVLRQG